jgi:hypothetical protein
MGNDSRGEGGWREIVASHKAVACQSMPEGYQPYVREMASSRPFCW